LGYLEFGLIHSFLFLLTGLQYFSVNLNHEASARNARRIIKCLNPFMLKSLIQFLFVRQDDLSEKLILFSEFVVVLEFRLREDKIVIDRQTYAHFVVSLF
jgi:hypothetical protein